MRKFLRVILPSFIPFVVFWAIAKYSGQFSLGVPDDNSREMFLGLIAYYKYLAPLLFIAALLTQYLIIIPLWNKVITKTWGVKITSFILLFLVCLSAAVGLSYLIWDEQDGISWWINTCQIMTGIQMAYWFINLLILTLVSSI